jgi:hypothetical protein
MFLEQLEQQSDILTVGLLLRTRLALIFAA